MRKFVLFLVAFVLGVVVGMPGCTSGPAAPTGTPATQPVDQIGSLIRENAAQIKAAATVATSGVLISLDEPQRSHFGALAYEVANVLNTAASQDDVSIGRLKVLATDMIAGRLGADEVQVGIVLDSVLSLVEERVNLDALKGAKVVALRAFLKDASDGVLSVTQRYAPS